MENIFSSRLERAIKSSGLKQAAIAAKTGLTPAYISELKSGRKENPSLETIRKLAVAIGVSEAWLADGSGKMVAAYESASPKVDSAVIHDRLAAGPAGAFRSMDESELVAAIREYLTEFERERHVWMRPARMEIVLAAATELHRRASITAPIHVKACPHRRAEPA